MFAETGEWSAPPQSGFQMSGRMGHASVYDLETGLIFVEGGVILNNNDMKEITTQLLAYNTVSHVWSSLNAR